MSPRSLRILIVFNVIATLGAIVWAAIWLYAGGLALYDSNLEAFMIALSPEQGRGISAMATSILRGAVIPLLITNGIWLALVGTRWMMAEDSGDSHAISRPEV